MEMSKERINACQTETELDKLVDSLIPDEELLLVSLNKRCEILDVVEEDGHDQAPKLSVSPLLFLLVIW